MGQQEYKDRLVTLDLLPLCYDRELKDLIFFYKALCGYIDIDISKSFENTENTILSNQHLSVTLFQLHCQALEQDHSRCSSEKPLYFIAL